MSNLSRRGFLAGLLSSAALIAAGPVAKFVAIDNAFGVGPAMQAFDSNGSGFESYTSYFRWKPYVETEWKHALSAINLSCDVLEIGPEADSPLAAVWRVGWEKAPA